MRGLLAVAVMAMVGAAPLHAAGPPTYKCVDGKKISYSDEPCVGATVVDTTPTQGLDKSSGTSRRGADVTRAEHNRIMADGLRPITGQTAEQRAIAIRRVNLPVSAKFECHGLDSRIGGDTKLNASTLYANRKRFRELGC